MIKCNNYDLGKASDDHKANTLISQPKRLSIKLFSKPLKMTLFLFYFLLDLNERKIPP